MSLEYVISATDQFSSVFDKFAKKAKSIGDSMTAAGKKLTAGITLPIVGLATAAGLASVEFESAFTGVKYCPLR